MVNIRGNTSVYSSQPVDYNLGDSLSESSKDCSEEGREESGVYVILVKRYMQSRPYLGRMLLRFLRNRYLSGLSAFLSKGICKKLGS